MKQTEIIEAVCEQIGTLGMSKHHKKSYKAMPVTLENLLTHNITMAKLKTRNNDNVRGFHKAIIIDHDGDADSWKLVKYFLDESKYSYIAFPSPSNKSARSLGKVKMRIVMPCRGITKKKYKYKYLYIIYDLKIGKWVDNSTSDESRFFYPPIMNGITQANNDNPKPTDQTMEYALENVHAKLGKVYVLPKSPDYDKVVPNLEQRGMVKLENGRYIESDRETVYFPDDMNIKHHGKVIGTFEEIADLSFDRKIRCDCPFENHEKHHNKGEDYAYVYGGSILCSGQNTFVTAHNGKKYYHDAVLGIRESLPRPRDLFTPEELAKMPDAFDDK